MCALRWLCVCVCCGVCGVLFFCVCVYMWCWVLVLCVYMWCCVLCGLCLCVRVVWWCVWCGVVCGEAWHAENSLCVRSKRLRVCVLATGPPSIFPLPWSSLLLPCLSRSLPTESFNCSLSTDLKSVFLTNSRCSGVLAQGTAEQKPDTSQRSESQQTPRIQAASPSVSKAEVNTGTSPDIPPSSFPISCLSDLSRSFLHLIYVSCSSFHVLLPLFLDLLSSNLFGHSISSYHRSYF